MARKLERQARELIGKNWGKSSGTNRKMLSNIRCICRFLETTGIQRIQDLKSKHVLAYVAFLKGQGREDSTIQSHLTTLRKISGRIGKQNIVPRSNAEAGAPRANRYQPKTTNMEKHDEIRQKLYDKDERLGIAHDLRQAFGLRVTESLRSHDIIEKGGTLFLKIEGAKNGRPRDVPIDTLEKVRVAGRLVALIKRQGTPGLIPAERTLKEYSKYQTNVLSRVGATKQNGCNAHTLRHHHAQRMVAEGHSVAEVQQELGHGETRHLWHYVHRQ